MIQFDGFCDFSQAFSGFLPFSDILETNNGLITIIINKLIALVATISD